MRKTKILCTLGPATESPEVIAELIAKGADVMRLNMSHASHEWVRTVYARIRDAAANSKREIAVLMDLTGPSIRTGDVEQPWQLQVGDTVEFRCLPEATASTHYSVTVNYPELGKDLKAGDIIMVSSVAGFRGGGDESIYAGTKHAQVGFAGGLDRELREKGVRVALVCPAGTDTQFAIEAGRTAGEPKLASYLRPDDVAFQIVQIMRQPLTVRTHIWTLWSMQQQS